jgi:hypothetical protein
MPLVYRINGVVSSNPPLDRPGTQAPRLADRAIQFTLTVTATLFLRRFSQLIYSCVSYPTNHLSTAITTL